jgi:hypothetical protein
MAALRIITLLVAVLLVISYAAAAALNKNERLPFLLIAGASLNWAAFQMSAALHNYEIVLFDVAFLNWWSTASRLVMGLVLLGIAAPYITDALNHGTQ